MPLPCSDVVHVLEVMSVEWRVDVPLASAGTREPSNNAVRHGKPTPPTPPPPMGWEMSFLATAKCVIAQETQQQSIHFQKHTPKLRCLFQKFAVKNVSDSKGRSTGIKVSCSLITYILPGCGYHDTVLFRQRKHFY